jgi:hypothetical protein
VTRSDPKLREDYSDAVWRLFEAARDPASTQVEHRDVLAHVNEARQALQTIVMCSESARLEASK